MVRSLIIVLLVLAASGAAAQPSSQGQIRAQIDALSTRLTALAADQSRGGDMLGEGRGQLAVLNASEADLMARLGASQNQLSRLLGALQMYGADPPPALFIHPDDAKKAVRAAILIRAITPELERRARVFGGQATQAMRVRRSAASASEALMTTQSDIAERASRIDELIAEKAALEQQLGEEPAAVPDVPALAARIQTLRADPSAVAAPARGSAAPAKLSPPVVGPPALRFGQSAPRGGAIEGWTWNLSPGAQVVSPAPARVEYAGPLRGWDSVLILDIGGGYHLVLAGIHTVLTTSGATLMAGQPIAKMAPSPTALAGQNKAAPGPELYMEIRKGGDPVDPARFFAAIGQ